MEGLVRRGMLGMGLAMILTLGAVGVVPQTEAVTTNRPSSVISPNNTSSTITFVLGEDGGVWYTVTNYIGSVGKTGNDSNVFDASSFSGASGFVSKTSLATIAGTTTTCTGIWCKTPGIGAFQAGPRAIRGGQGNPIAGNTSRITLLTVGQDKNVWYTIMDTNAGNVSFIGGIAGTNVPTDDPFGGAPETGDTGFVAQSNLITECGSQRRTCVGIWVAFP